MKKIQYLTLHKCLFLVLSFFLLNNAAAQNLYDLNPLKSYNTIKVDGADLDNDLDLDMVAISQYFLILENTGNGNFITQEFDLYIDNFSFQDIDHDGLTDILVIYKQNDNLGQQGLGYLRNEGSFTFSPLIEILPNYGLYENTTFTSASELCIGKINSDEFPDLVVAFNSEVSYLPGNASGFSTNAVNTGYNISTFMGFLDINEDGFLDIMYSSTYFTSEFGQPQWVPIAAFKLNDGSGNFTVDATQKVILNSGVFGGSSDLGRFADINNDGLKDIVMEMSGDIIFYTYSQANDRFEYQSNIIRYANLNHSSGFNSYTIPISTLSKWDDFGFHHTLGKDLFGTSTFGAVSDTLMYDPETEMMEFYCYYHPVLFNGLEFDGTPIYRIPKYREMGEDFENILNFLDLNSDGHLDIVLGVHGLSVMYQDDAGQFSPPQEILIKQDQFRFAGAFPGCQVGDLNGDGFKDIVAESASGILVAYVNNTTGQYTKTEIDLDLPNLSEDTILIKGMDGYNRFALADLNNDGLTDITVVQLDLSDFNGNLIFSQYLNIGNNNFELHNSWSDPLNGFWESNYETLGRLKYVNYNNDGYPDLVFRYAGFAQGQVLMIYPSDENGNYGEPVDENIFFSMTSSQRDLFDITGDGVVDLIGIDFLWENDPPTNVVLIHSNVNGNLIQTASIPFQHQPGHGLYCDDVDGNGLPDILAYNSYGPIYTLFLQTAPYSFTEIALPSDSPLLGLIDVNQDGLPELIYRNEVMIASSQGYQQSVSTDFFANLQDQNAQVGSINNPGIALDYALPLQYMQQINSEWEPNAKFLTRSARTGWMSISEIDISSIDPVPLSTVNVHVFNDLNANNVLDQNETRLTNIPVAFDQNLTQYTSVLNGQTARLISGGPHIITVTFPEIWSVNNDGVLHITVTDDSPAFQNVYFAVTPNGTIHQLEVTANPSPSVCSTESSIQFQVLNTGNQTSSGVVSALVDENLQVSSIVPTPVSQNQDTIFWNLTNMLPGELRSFNINAMNPNFEFMGNPIHLKIHAAYTGQNNVILAADTSESDQILLCAYDPNDITEHTGLTDQGFIDAGQLLDFTIRFQNTGNAPATDVRVEQMLSSYLDKSTLVPVAWSDPFSLSIDSDGHTIFLFENIMLPDSTSDEPGSHGFVRYHVRALPDLAPGTVINSTAEIFFDFNPAVITNTEVNTVYSPTVSVNNFETADGIFVYPNPSKNLINVIVPSELIGNQLQLFNALGQNMHAGQTIRSGQTQFDLSDLTNGFYILSIGDKRTVIIKE